MATKPPTRKACDKVIFTNDSASDSQIRSDSMILDKFYQEILLRSCYAPLAAGQWLERIKGWSQSAKFLVFLPRSIFVGGKFHVALDKIHVVLGNSVCSSSNPANSMFFFHKNIQNPHSLSGDG